MPHCTGRTAPSHNLRGQLNYTPLEYEVVAIDSVYGRPELRDPASIQSGPYTVAIISFMAAIKCVRRLSGEHATQTAGRARGNDHQGKAGKHSDKHPTGCQINRVAYPQNQLWHDYVL